jgi:hypothetical protein
LATRQYEICLLALARNSAAYLQWLQVQLDAYELESAATSRVAWGARSLIGTLSSSVRELMFRIAEDLQNSPAEKPQLASNEAVSSVIIGGIETVAWLARYEEERPRGDDEPRSAASTYRSAIAALTLGKPVAQLAIMAPRNFLNASDIKRACANLDIRPSKATFTWINRPAQKATT